MVERFWPAACNAQNGPIASTTHEMLRDGNGAWVRFSDIASLQKELAERTKERDEARRKLFPYADATEISGYSTTGIYLIGDRKSIKAVEKAFHYSAQIDEYRVAFDERIKAAEARADALAKKVEGLEAALQKARWYVEVYDTREHNTEQDDTLTEIDAALEAKP